MSAFAEFEDLELKGWQDRAAGYDEATLRMTGSTISALVARAGIQPGHRVLDVCCGTGEVARQVSEHTPSVTGLDFSPSMIVQAQAKLPDATFMEGDAQDLPFEDASFDAVVTNFGHYHLADPDRAISEAARVLKPGGMYAFTTWCGPDTSPGFKMILETVLGNVDPETELPAAPDAFRLSDPQTAREVMSGSGFADVSVITFPSTITCKANEFVTFLKAATVRATMVLNAQPDETRSRIEALLLERAKEFVVDGNAGETIVLPVPNLIISGVRSTGFMDS